MIAERIKNVARRLLETQRGRRSRRCSHFRDGRRHRQSAKTGRRNVAEPTEREIDVLLATGERAATALTARRLTRSAAKRSRLTGAEAGILTDRIHTKARIANISPRQIHELLAEDYIVLVAGFQGQTPKAKQPRSAVAVPI